MDKNELIAEVSRCLKTVRAEYDFSQTQMASILGISKKSLVETEKKRRNLTWPECVAFVTLFSSSSILQNSFGGEMSDMMKAIAFNDIQPIYPKTLGGKIWWKNIREEKGYQPRVKDVVVVAFGLEDAAAKVVVRKKEGLYFCPDSDYEGENGAAYQEYPAEEGQVFGVVELVIHNPKAV